MSDLINSKHKNRVLVVGLDGAGKTTMMYKLKLGDVILGGPSIGFPFETTEYNDISFITFDLDTNEQYRPLWRFYYPDTHGIIFMVDSAEIHHRIGYSITQQQLQLLCAGYIRSNHTKYFPSQIQNLCSAFSAPCSCWNSSALEQESDCYCNGYTAQKELKLMTNEKDLKDVAFLIFANKNDL
eukprot:210226_1